MNSTRIARLVSLLLLVAAGAAPAADPVNPKPSPEPKPLVLCWYMVCYMNSVEVYKQEIELAQRHGIDGFLLDAGAWMKPGKNGKLEPTGYVTAAARLYEAARQLDSGFHLAMAPEYSVRPFAENVEDMVLRTRNHPNQLRHGGKVVLSGYGKGESFPPAIERLQKRGVEVCLVPHLFPPRYMYLPDMQNYVDELRAVPELDGLMGFNPSQLGSILRTNAQARRATMRLGKIYGAAVTPAYNSANLEDYRGLSGYLDMWRGAIEDGADWISLVIWNDYNEDSGLMPYRWPGGEERHHFDRDESYLYATRYASAWFKSGVRPTIPQDMMFVTYRDRSKWLRKAWNGKEWVDNRLMEGRFDQIHDDVQDAVYVDTFLTAPASVTVRIGEKEHRFDLPAGVGHAEVPMVPGVPRLTLQRDGKTLADVTGRKKIVAKPTKRNSFVGYHLLNRTWASGTAIGPATRYEAETGKLQAGAKVVTQGKVKAVQNEQADGSGVAVPVQDLQTGTYNVRIVYANPTDEEARLTLSANGPPRGKTDCPYFIPAFLPPTDGEFRTVSFLWSLYDTTSELKLAWKPGVRYQKPAPDDNDLGRPLIDAIELVKVEPIATPKPRDPGKMDLIWIPGGTFTMGSDKGEPDEKPAHAVTISGFAMGKYEVTNEQFELFDPKHRAVRNSVSWRDREPVVYVSWLDAAKYCNWLSEQYKLTPAYSEQTVEPRPGKKTKAWVIDPEANGFRLPTEAQWEYVASGRDEERIYPWGNDAPKPNVHGRFEGEAAKGAGLPRAATQRAGVSVVGSYPCGASRDGVMDLAGNVGEWCTDWYAPYPTGAQTDPCQTTPGNFRVIRGGSWSWYGFSQRAADREFNSQNYPGHAYYGFRVALPNAGWQKVQDKD